MHSIKPLAAGLGIGLMLVASCATSPSSSPPLPKTVNVSCDVGDPCSATLTTRDGTAATVDLGTGSGATITFSVNTGAQIVCGGYQGVDPNTYDLKVSGSDQPKQLEIDIPGGVVGEQKKLPGTPEIPKGPPIPKDPANIGEVCYGSPNQFDTASGEPAAFNEDTAEYEGLLPDCRYDSPGAAEPFNMPCVLPAEQKKDGTLLLRALLPAGDPRTK